MKQSELMIARMYERYMSKMSNLAGTLELLRSNYKDSSVDMKIFENLLANPFGHSWMYESYRMSPYSVIKDIAMGSHDIWQDAPKIRCDVLFLHGRHDPINAAGNARKIAALFENSVFIELEEECQSLFLRHLADLVTRAPVGDTESFTRVPQF